LESLRRLRGVLEEHQELLNAAVDDQRTGMGVVPPGLQAVIKEILAALAKCE
jgi:hypothetical protein